jgi:hypothetical protein
MTHPISFFFISENNLAKEGAEFLANDLKEMINLR